MRTVPKLQGMTMNYTVICTKRIDDRWRQHARKTGAEHAKANHAKGA